MKVNLNELFGSLLGFAGEHPVCEKKDGGFASFALDDSAGSSGRAEKIPNALRGDPDPADVKIAEMRKLRARERLFLWDSSDPADTFVFQASFLSDLEDDFPEKAPFQSYRPVYEKMSRRQLRTFFTWRTKIRRGVFEEIPLSYVYLYLYELINRTNGKSDEEILREMIVFWKEYRQFTHHIDSYLKTWVRDFYVTSEIRMPYACFESLFPEEFRAGDAAKARIAAGDYSGAAVYLDSVSSYKISKSKLFQSDYGPLLDHCICAVFTKLRQYAAEKGIELNDIVIGSFSEVALWEPFSGAVYSPPEKKSGKAAVISDCEKYVCRGGRWRQYAYTSYGRCRVSVGYILKLTDKKLRELLGHPNKLTANLNGLEKDVINPRNPHRLTTEKVHKMVTDPAFRAVIEATVEACFFTSGIPNGVMAAKRTKKKAVQEQPVKKPVIEFDTEKFSAIRENAKKIQERLIIIEDDPTVWEQTETPTCKSPPVLAVLPQVQETNEYRTFWSALSQKDKEIIRMILSGAQPDALSRYAAAVNELPQLLYEEINASFLELMGDNLIDTSGERPYIYEDYIDGLKEAAGGNNNE